MLRRCWRCLDYFKFCGILSHGKNLTESCYWLIGAREVFASVKNLGGKKSRLG
jgi:hypothetical protein